jgi:hypothetical protein
MTIKIKLLDSISSIEKNIKSATAEYMNDIVQKSQNGIINDIKSLIPSWIRSQPEIQSLLSSDPYSLVGVFGITKSSATIVDSIIAAVLGSISFKFIKFNDSLKGGFTVNIQPITFSNLLQLPDGYTNYSGGSLHWMDWLLLRGDETIIANYQYNPKTGIGRSNLGNMVTGGSFRVPPQFSGTAENNFITRALTGQPQIDQINKIFISYLK